MWRHFIVQFEIFSLLNNLWTRWAAADLIPAIESFRHDSLKFLKFVKETECVTYVVNRDPFFVLFN